MREVLAQLETRFPAMAAYTRRAARAHGARTSPTSWTSWRVALYMDDDELFTDFLAWTAGILEARRVPAASLRPVLDVLGAELKDFPRTTRLLGRARTVLDAFPAPAGPTTGAFG